MGQDVTAYEANEYGFRGDVVAEIRNPKHELYEALEADWAAGLGVEIVVTNQGLHQAQAKLQAAQAEYCAPDQLEYNTVSLKRELEFIKCCLDGTNKLISFT